MTSVDFSDIFEGRPQAKMARSLKLLAISLQPKQKIVSIDLSNNQFGSEGVRSFKCLLKGMSTLEVLKVNNCCLGPEGGVQIAEALAENQGLRLRHFEAGSDRL